MNGLISEENEISQLVQLVGDYKNWKKSEEYEMYLESLKKR